MQQGRGATAQLAKKDGLARAAAGAEAQPATYERAACAPAAPPLAPRPTHPEGAAGGPLVPQWGLAVAPGTQLALPSTEELHPLGLELPGLHTDHPPA
jgi:hypothetical protein